MKHWSAEDLEFLEKNYQSENLEMICEKLCRSKYAVQWKASKLGLLIRDGKKEKASQKIIVNVTQKQYDFITKNRNHSSIVRKAINLLMKNESKK